MALPPASSSSLAAEDPCPSTCSVAAPTEQQQPSNSGMSQGNAAQVDSRLQHRAQNVADGFVKTLQWALNDGSISLSRVSEHLHRKVPQIVRDAQQLHDVAERVRIANTDMADARQVVADMERIEAFCNIGNMIQRSMDLVKNADTPSPAHPPTSS